MRRLIDGRRFESRQILDKGGVIGDAEFRHCEFVFCSLGVRSDVRKRPTVRNVTLQKCVAEASAIKGAILEDILVDGLQTNGIFRVEAAAFRHVTLRGAIEEILIQPVLWPGPNRPGDDTAFEEANSVFYAATDWALDISEADFVAAEIQGIPAHLIRRDPESQVIVSRENALAGTWRRLGLGDTPWPGMIQFLIDDGYPAKLLIAPRRSPDYRRLQDGLTRLKEAGVAQ